MPSPDGSEHGEWHAGRPKVDADGSLSADLQREILPVTPSLAESNGREWRTRCSARWGAGAGWCR